MLNVQDSWTIHGFPGSVTLVEEYGHIGTWLFYMAVSFVKMYWSVWNSVILDEAEIGENTIVGANSTASSQSPDPGKFTGAR